MSDEITVLTVRSLLCTAYVLVYYTVVGFSRITVKRRLCNGVQGLTREQYISVITMILSAFEICIADATMQHSRAVGCSRYREHPRES